MLELPRSFYLLRPRTRRESTSQLKLLAEGRLVTSSIMNQALFVLVFLAGMLMAMLLGDLFGEYIKANLRSGKVGRLPDMSYLTVLEETTVKKFSTQLAKVEQEKKVANPDSAGLAEAMQSLHAATEMKKLGKVEKASKLYQHAMALAPRNAEVLNTFGEFLEESRQDLLQADHFFARAAAFSISGSDDRQRALENRKRTAIKVEELDKDVLRNIDKKKAAFLDISENSAAMKRAKKEAYFQYVYHTVGIEGNTMDLAQTRSILETKLAVAGKSIMEHNEILGMDAALKYINQTLVDKIGDITLQDILEIHKRVIGHVDPVEAGLFRRNQVYVGDHVPPPPSLLENLIGKFITWLNSYEALALHPVRLAALAHYKLVYIHPFVDGNGRTSRLLMNLVLMQAGFPPVIIRRADREAYYHYLTVANEGDIRPFVRFIARCTEKTLDAYLWATGEYNKKDQIEQQEASLPANLLEHSIDQVHSSLRDFRSAVPADTFLDFSDPRAKIIVGQLEKEQDQVIRLPGGDTTPYWQGHRLPGDLEASRGGGSKDDLAGHDSIDEKHSCDKVLRTGSERICNDNLPKS